MGDASKELCLFPECPDQGAAALHGTQFGAGAALEIPEIASAEVRHGVVLQIAPDVFDGVELRSVGGQILERDGPAQCFDMPAYEVGSVGLQTVPDDQNLPADRGREYLEELHDLQTFDRAGKQPEVKALHTQTSNRGELLPTETVLQDGRLAFGSPRGRATGPFGQSRLIDKYDEPALPRRYFFSSGHLCFFHMAMARSSRWRAWPVGRCTLQPICSRKTRQTDPLAMRTPNRSAINAPMRGTVQISVAYPAASAPCFKHCASSFSWASDNRRGRPRRPSCASCLIPPAANARCQRITDCRDTPVRRATSAGHSPCSSSRAPLTRRRFMSFLRFVSFIEASYQNIRDLQTASKGKSVTHLRDSQ